MVDAERSNESVVHKIMLLCGVSKLQNKQSKQGKRQFGRFNNSIIQEGLTQGWLKACFAVIRRRGSTRNNDEMKSLHSEDIFDHN